MLVVGWERLVSPASGGGGTELLPKAAVPGGGVGMGRGTDIMAPACSVFLETARSGGTGIVMRFELLRLAPPTPKVPIPVPVTPPFPAPPLLLRVSIGITTMLVLSRLGGGEVVTTFSDLSVFTRTCWGTGDF